MRLREFVKFSGFAAVASIVHTGGDAAPPTGMASNHQVLAGLLTRYSKAKDCAE
jgi:hypothetical protein